MKSVYYLHIYVWLWDRRWKRLSSNDSIFCYQFYPTSYDVLWWMTSPKNVIRQHYSRLVEVENPLRVNIIVSQFPPNFVLAQQPTSFRVILTNGFGFGIRGRRIRRRRSRFRVASPVWTCTRRRSTCSLAVEMTPWRWLTSEWIRLGAGVYFCYL